MGENWTSSAWCMYLTNSLHDLASSINDMNVIAARRATLYGAEMDVFHR